MKRFYFSFLLSFTYLCIHAQTISSHVVGSAGNTVSTPKMRLSWTLGEVAVARWETPNQTGILTEGFHQPTIEWSKNTLSDLELVQLVPNPVKNLLNLQVIANDETYYLAQLQDAQGKILITNFNLKGKTAIDMSGYAAGMYFLSIHAPTGIPLQHHKIIKL